MAKFNNMSGGTDGKSFILGLILLFAGVITMVFALVSIVFATTILYASQSIAEANIMADYKYPYACFTTADAKAPNYATEQACSDAVSTNYWAQDTSAEETKPYANWVKTNDSISDLNKAIVNALLLAIAFVGLVFFILGLRNTGIWKSSNSDMA